MVKPSTEILRGRRVFQVGQKIEALEEQLSDPANWPSLKTSFANIRPSRYNLAWLAKQAKNGSIETHTRLNLARLFKRAREWSNLKSAEVAGRAGNAGHGGRQADAEAGQGFSNRCYVNYSAPC